MSSALAPATGIIGVFFVMLGAGVILDADWIWRGGSAIVVGGILLLARWRAPGGGES